tara:strand:+ start:62 stop:466 length:405 start_codon:yes stop_codon:yes gene_type:complete
MEKVVKGEEGSNSHGDRPQITLAIFRDSLTDSAKIDNKQYFIEQTKLIYSGELMLKKFNFDKAFSDIKENLKRSKFDIVTNYRKDKQSTKLVEGVKELKLKINELIEILIITELNDREELKNLRKEIIKFLNSK